MRPACLLKVFLLTAIAMQVAAGPTRPKAAHPALERPSSPAPGHSHPSRSDRFIVGFAKGSNDTVARRLALQRAAAPQGLQASDLHGTVGGMRVIRTSRPLDANESQAFVQRLRREPGVDYAVRDGRMRVTYTPNDPMYAQQWNLGPTAWGRGVRANLAWDRAQGSGVVVAVLDTGITTHPDLAGKVLPGYDFITDLPTAGDGDGRDADPSDPGDWNAADECDPAQAARDSSWHGTHMAGVVAAVTNNGIGVAGTAPAAQVMPLRVLGHCGGFTSDVADAILWAAGGNVAGLPPNPNPVDVVNMSLGGDEPCILPLQSAIDFARSQGVVVVASAGNAGSDVRRFAPASCAGVVVVGATDAYGTRAWYSNTGELVDLSAPGGTGGSKILSAHNTGTTTVGSPTYSGFEGTSPAAATVSGIVALMQSVAPASPAAVEAILAGSAAPLSPPCLHTVCGGGLADAEAAVDAAIDGALMIGDAEIMEGAGGISLVSVEVRLSRPMATPVSFDIATTAGPYDWNSAAPASDYQPLLRVGEVFAPGVTLRRYAVQIVGDALPEPDELLQVVLSNVQGVVVARSAARVRLINDDPVPLANGVGVGPFSSSLLGMRQLFSIEVPQGATSLTFHFTHEGGDLGMVVMPGVLPELDQGDCAGFDWWGETLCNYPNPQPGIWYVMLYAGDYLNARLTASYQAPPPSPLSIGDASVREGDGGTTALSFPVILTSASATDVQFAVAVEDGTAHAGDDYLLPLTQLHSIPAGQLSTTVEITVAGDTRVEANETLAVELRDVQGANLTRGRAQGRIVNDDLATLSIADISVTETDAVSTATFILTLSTPMPSPVAFDVRTVAGSAHAGSDFAARSLTGRYLDAGRTRQVFEVALVGDNVAEATESFTVVVENLIGALPGDLSATVSVADDDAPTVAAKRSAASVRPRAARLDGERTR
jgi:serine protease